MDPTIQSLLSPILLNSLTKNILFILIFYFNLKALYHCFIHEKWRLAIFPALLFVLLLKATIVEENKEFLDSFNPFLRERTLNYLDLFKSTQPEIQDPKSDH
jgi:hypothetical protein